MHDDSYVIECSPTEEKKTFNSLIGIKQSIELKSNKFSK